MKVRVTLTVELDDPAQWDLAFASGTLESAIRADVKQYVLGLVQGQGVFGNGEVGAEIKLA